MIINAIARLERTVMQMIDNRLPAVALAQPVVAPVTPPSPQVTLQLKTLDISDTLLEYHSGINGGAALREQEETMGTSWRSGKAESRFFRRRGTIYNHLDELIGEGMTFEAARERIMSLYTESRCTSVHQFGGWMDSRQQQEEGARTRARGRPRGRGRGSQR